MIEVDNEQSTFSLATNLQGRIRNLALAPSAENSVYPLLEALMNSIQAVQERFEKTKLSKGKIDISIERGEDTLDITVVDNGIGLTDKNFAAFLTPDTDNKLVRGGKGVGRLTWLKTFSHSKIESLFEFNGQLRKRSFLFQISELEAVSKHELLTITGREPGTTISLQKMLEGYRHTFPAKGKTIANHIIRHFLPILISTDCPEITFFDGGKYIDIGKQLKSNIREEKVETISFLTTDKETVSLKISQMRIASRSAPKSSPTDMTKSGTPVNAVYFAANQRVGFDYILDSQLGMTTFDGSKYIGILEGIFIDGHINQERTHLDISFDDMKSLKDTIFKSVTIFLSHYMEEVKEDQREVFETLKKDFPSIAASAPDDFIEKLPYSYFKREEVFSNLAKYKIRTHSTNEKQAKKISDTIEELELQKTDLSFEQEKEISDNIKDIQEKLSEDSNNTLIEYMVRRKSIIQLLDKYMGLSGSGNHFKEDLIHNLICPIRRIDNKDKLLDHNLWILDDRFSFYSFLASDKALNTFADTPYAGRPDVLFILDEQLAFDSKNASPIFIVEFKRPARTSYRTPGDKEWDVEDPFSRFKKYKESLQNGIDAEKTHDGRYVKITDSRPFHFFLIADMTKNLETKCEILLDKIEGSNSYYGYVKQVGTVHAISYDDLIQNTKLRHELFFQKLGIGEFSNPMN